MGARPLYRLQLPLCGNGDGTLPVREGQKKYARAFVVVGPPGFEPGTNRL